MPRSRKHRNDPFGNGWTLPSAASVIYDMAAREVVCPVRILRLFSRLKFATDYIGLVTNLRVSRFGVMITFPVSNIASYVDIIVFFGRQLLCERGSIYAICPIVVHPLLSCDCNAGQYRGKRKMFTAQSIYTYRFSCRCFYYNSDSKMCGLSSETLVVFIIFIFVLLFCYIFLYVFFIFYLFLYGLVFRTFWKQLWKLLFFPLDKFNLISNSLYTQTNTYIYI